MTCHHSGECKNEGEGEGLEEEMVLLQDGDLNPKHLECGVYSQGKRERERDPTEAEGPAEKPE